MRRRVTLACGFAVSIMAGIAAGRLADAGGRAIDAAGEVVFRAETLTDSLRRIEMYLARHDERDAVKEKR